MAHKKGVGSSRNGRESNAQRLGIKAFGNQKVSAGTVIIRQRGTKIYPGLNVMRAKDDTLFAVADGYVRFEARGRDSKKVGVYPEPKVNAASK